jgi:hypothetical protein
MAVVNTLAYYDMATITNVKSFLKQPQDYTIYHDFEACKVQINILMILIPNFGRVKVCGPQVLGQCHKHFTAVNYIGNLLCPLMHVSMRCMCFHGSHKDCSI